jgi:hypothetical protein
MGPFAKSFVIANRLAGWSLTVFGILVIAGAIQRVAMGRFAGFGLGWHFLLGATCLAVGVLYIRAPLSRPKGTERGGSAD